MNNEVSTFLDEQNHPFRDEIEQLRYIILEANSELVECIKWNGPNYAIGMNDRITMRIQPPKKQAQLIFHRGSKKVKQPENKLIDDPSNLLVWKENDRAIATFNHLEDIHNTKRALCQIIQDWIKATTE